MIAWYLERWFWRVIWDGWGRARLGVLRSRMYQEWDAKGWDKVGTPDIEDVLCSAGLGDQSDLGYQGKRWKKQEPGCHESTWLIWKPLFLTTSISQNIPENQQEGRGVSKEPKIGARKFG